MGGYKCEYMQRKKGDIKIYCTAPEMADMGGLCGCQYYCSNSFRNEMSNLSLDCSIRRKNREKKK